MIPQLQYRIQHLQKKLTEKHIHFHEQFLPVVKYLMGTDPDYKKNNEKFISQTEAMRWWREKTAPTYDNKIKTKSFYLRDATKEVEEHYRQKELFQSKKQSLFDALQQPDRHEDDESESESIFDDEPLVESTVPPNTIPPGEYSESLRRVQELRTRKKDHKERKHTNPPQDPNKEDQVHTKVVFADQEPKAPEEASRSEIRQNLHQARLQRKKNKQQEGSD